MKVEVGRLLDGGSIIVRINGTERYWYDHRIGSPTKGRWFVGRYKQDKVPLEGETIEHVRQAVEQGFHPTDKAEVDEKELVLYMLETM